MFKEETFTLPEPGSLHLQPTVVGRRSLLFFWRDWLGFLTGVILSLVFQIPYEDRCLNPQTPPEARPLGAPNTSSEGTWRNLED